MWRVTHGTRVSVTQINFPPPPPPLSPPPLLLLLLLLLLLSLLPLILVLIFLSPFLIFGVARLEIDDAGDAAIFVQTAPRETTQQIDLYLYLSI